MPKPGSNLSTKEKFLMLECLNAITVTVFFIIMLCATVLCTC